MGLFLKALVCCSLLFSWISSKVIQDEREHELILLQIVFRNGISAPEKLYLKDPNPPKLWEDGLGQLTLTGKKQLFNIGKDLRKRYRKFITSNPHEVTVQSSVHPKCMSSALSLMASMYAPTNSWEFKKGMKWQPVPVYYTPPKEDQLLGSFHQCPAVVKESERAVLLSGIKTLPKMYKQLMKQWTSNSGMTIKNCNHASSLFEILLAEKLSNMIIPAWARKTWKDLRRLHDFSYELHFNNPSILKVIGGPLLERMVKNAVGKTEGFLRDTKILIYSGEAEHVAGVLGAANCFNNKEPPFGSMVLIELFKMRTNETKDFSVRLSFMNETAPGAHTQNSPVKLVFPGCGEFCPLGYVSNLTKHRENEQWSSDCKGR